MALSKRSDHRSVCITIYHQGILLLSSQLKHSLHTYIACWTHRLTRVQFAGPIPTRLTFVNEPNQHFPNKQDPTRSNPRKEEQVEQGRNKVATRSNEYIIGTTTPDTAQSGQASLNECYSNHIITRISIQTAGLAFGGTGLCTYRVRGADDSCAKHLTV